VRSFLGFEFSQYQGLPPSQRPLSICTPMSQAPCAIPYTFNWSADYALSTARPNFLVILNPFNTGAGLVIDKVRSVYIDNLGCNFPVYIQFPSTGFIVAAQPNSACWYPVFSNDFNVNVAVEGFTDGDAGSITGLFLSNVFMEAYVDNELPASLNLGRASTDIPRGGNFANSRYAPFALGDQTNQAQVSLAAPETVNLFAPPVPQASGFYYVTDLTISIAGVFNAAGILSTASLQVRNATDGLILLTPSFYIPALVDFLKAPTNSTMLVALHNAQLKLDATKTWVLSNTNLAITSGIADCFVAYTYQDH
jgi:hypothetical protein